MKQIIQLLGTRARYVHAAARFKTSEAHVAAPDRQTAMLQVRRAVGGARGLSPDVIEEVYRRLVAYFIEREMEEWREKKVALKPPVCFVPWAYIHHWLPHMSFTPPLRSP